MRALRFFYLPANKIFTISIFRSFSVCDKAYENSSDELKNNSNWICFLVYKNSTKTPLKASLQLPLLQRCGAAELQLMPATAGGGLLQKQKGEAWLSLCGSLSLYIPTLMVC